MSQYQSIYPSPPKRTALQSGEMDTDPTMTQPGGPNEEVAKPTYKSFKKKYKKMRIKFDQIMKENNSIYKAEDRAKETARRLAIENDRLMEMLLDINNQPSIDPSVRYDLGLDFDKTLEDELEAIKLDVDMPPEIKAKVLATRDMANHPPQKSLARLLEDHPPYNVETLTQADRDNIFIPETYLTTDQLDEAANEYDDALGFPVSSSTSLPRPRPLTDKELEIQNPSSVYNWLRKNESQVFLQDADSTSTSKNTSSRAAASKKATHATPSNSKADDRSVLSPFGDEDMDSESHVTPMLNKKSASKRKRATDEDVGYRPKGSGRPSKKKKAESGGRKSGAAVPSSAAKQKKDKEKEDVAMGDVPT